jgi:Lon protease-like protein
LFPLSVVLFPGMLLPLHVFEDRYRQLVIDLERRPAGSDRRFGVILLRQGREVGDDGALALHRVGCTAQLRDVEALADGEFNLVTTGVRRFQLHEVDSGKEYFQGDVEWLEDPPGDDPSRWVSEVQLRFRAYRATLGMTREQPLPDDPTPLSYVVSAALVLEPTEQQQLLDCNDSTERLRLARRLLVREQALLEALPSLPARHFDAVAITPN